MAADWKLLPIFAALLLAMQALCWLAARGLGLRLERRAILCGLALPVLALSPWLFTTRLLAPTRVLSGIFPGAPVAPDHGRHATLGDTLYQLLPWEIEVRRALRAGRLPLWSDRLEGGSSPWSNPQAGALSAVAMLTRPLPIQHHLLAALAVKMLLAFDGVWLLARRLGRSRLSSLAAAAGLCLGGGLMAWALFPASTALAWVPWVSAGAIGLCRRPRAAAIATTAALVAALLLAGHPETALAGGLFAAVCGLSLRRRATGRREEGRHVPRGRRGRGEEPEPLAARSLPPARPRGQERWGSWRGEPARPATKVLLPAPLGGWVSWGPWRGLAAAALAAGLGFGLAAPQIVPFLASLEDSQRTREKEGRLSSPGAAGFGPADERFGSAAGFAPVAGFAPAERAFLRAPLGSRVFGVPYQGPFRGPWDWTDALCGYGGLVARAGAAVALLAARDRRAWPFLGCAAACLLLAAGFAPLARLAAAVPLLRLIAYPRLLMLSCLGLCVAGSFGTDYLLGWGRRARHARRPAAQGSPESLQSQEGQEAEGSPGRSDIDERPESPDGRDRPDRNAGVAAIAVGLAAAAGLAADHAGWAVLLWAALLGAAVLAWRRPRWGAAALLLVLAGDLGTWSPRLLPREEEALFYPRGPFLAQLAATAGDPARWRAVGGDYLVYPSVLPVYGLAEVRPNNPLAPSSYLRVLRAAFGFHPTMLDYYARFINLDHPLLDFLGVRAVVSSVALPPPRRLEPADGGRFAPFFLFRNPHALPRWFFPTAVEAIDRGALERWISGLADARRVAVWRDEVGSWFPAAPREPPAVSALALAPGRALLALTPGGRSGAGSAGGAGTIGGPGSTGGSRSSGGAGGAGAAGGERLLATSLLRRGWRAVGADGAQGAASRPLRALTVDGAFLGVLVPAGVTRVELSYAPPGFRAGLSIGAGALAIWLALAVLAVRRGARHRRPSARDQARAGGFRRPPWGSPPAPERSRSGSRRRFSPPAGEFAIGAGALANELAPAVSATRREPVNVS